MNRYDIVLFLSLLLPATLIAAERPTLYLVGDSTVRNSTRGQTGWGSVLGESFDTNRIGIANRALGGRSSRTFLTEGLWDKVLADLKPGDFVLIQFGHNDNGPMDEGRARASIKGNSDETRVITNKTTGVVEIVKSYGAYLRHYIVTAKEKGATPIVLSLVPRNIWKEDRVLLATGDFSAWTADAARQAGATFIDLNVIVADRYDQIGKEAVADLFQGDHTHTNEKGARMNAECVAEGVRQKVPALATFLSSTKRFTFAPAPAKPGYVHVTSGVAYDPSLGHGFEPGIQVFSVRLPEGNYRVAVDLGGDKPSTTTIKAESRRLMVNAVSTAAAQSKQLTFAVNIRTPFIDNTSSVRLKTREQRVLHWDEKLSLEFLGENPQVSGVVIEPDPAIKTVFLLGDSTVTDQPDEPWNSWGQMLTAFFGPHVAIANHAESGESLASSLSARRVRKVLSCLKPGDYVMIQFGHNDQKSKTPNAVDLFRANLLNLVRDVRKAGAQPVLITPMERMSGVENDTLAGYPDRVREVSRVESVPIIDLNKMSRTLYRALGPDLPRAFQDGTHHNAYGSYLLASCVVQGIRQAGLPLTNAIRSEIPHFNPAMPLAHASFSVAQTKPARDVYVFSYFIGNGEDGLHLAYSRDAYTWKPLNGGKSFLTPKVGESKLMRDPCLLHGPDGKFHMVWTTAWNGKTIGYAWSSNLVDWSEQKAIPVMAHEPAALNCWAPEIFWDAKNQEYLIFWATTVTNKFLETAGQSESKYNHRMYATTTRDFDSFTPTKLFCNPGFNVIDATILPAFGKFFMVIKDETVQPPMKHLRITHAPTPSGPYGELSPPFTRDWVEGPTWLDLGGEFIVYFDRYREHAFGAMVSKDLVQWTDVTSRLSMPKGLRHGTSIAVPLEILESLLKRES